MLPPSQTTKKSVGMIKINDLSMELFSRSNAASSSAQNWPGSRFGAQKTCEMAWHCCGITAGMKELSAGDALYNRLVEVACVTALASYGSGRRVVCGL